MVISNMRYNLFFGPDDYKFMSSIIDEKTNLFGVDGFYLQVKEMTRIDPYYQEAETKKYDVRRLPIKFFVRIVRIEEPMVTDRGLQEDTTIEAYVPASQLRAIKVQPQEGDVLEFWNKQFDVTDWEPIQVFGDKGVNIHNEPNSLYWKATLLRRKEFIPERKTKEQI